MGATNGSQRNNVVTNARSTDQELQEIPNGKRTEGIPKNVETGERGRADQVPFTEQRGIQDRYNGNAAKEQSNAEERNGLGESATHDVLGNASEGVRSGSPKRQRLTPAQKKNAKASETPGHNFHISDIDEIGNGGLKTKYNDNVAAIKLLKQFVSEHSLAMPGKSKNMKYSTTSAHYSFGM